MVISVHAALERLIDYAGLFPPAKLPLHEALDGYRAAAQSDAAWMLGRFIVPAAQLDALPADVPLSAIVEAREEAFGRLDAARERGLRIEALEIPAPDLRACASLRAAHGWDGVPAYVELSAADREPARIDAAMTSLAAANLRAKLRCGGLDAAAFPAPLEVARFIGAAARAGVAFKATAGLHHPVRFFNAQAGVMMHGFLNLLAAAAFGREDPAVVEVIVAEEDPGAFSLGNELRWRDRRADAAQVAQMRAERFIGYGSCSFDEPVEDLRALGILAR